MKKHFLALKDWTADELYGFINRALVLKAQDKHKQKELKKSLTGRTACLLFEKPSTRTRVSFEAAMYSLGGQVIFMSAKESQLGRGEPLKDTARVLSRYADALVVRTFGQNVVEELAHYADIPVINALTDLYHPCQVMSDLMTVIELKGDVSKLHIAWIGDGNNMANAWIEAAAIFGFKLSLACPEGFDPNPAVLQQSAGAKIRLLRDPAEAIYGADVVNTDVFASMGQEAEQEERLQKFQGYQVNEDLLQHAAKDSIVLHCLPAHRGEEISEEVLEGPQSRVFDQAENKMHLHRALLEHFITAAQ